MSEVDSEVVDELPSDLDVTKYVGPYQFPTPRKRRTASISIFIISISAVAIGFFSSNTAMLFGGLFMAFIGAIFFFCGWPLKIKDLDALTLAAKNSPFSVGHASAQLSFTGWFSKPLWRVVVFSSDEPPSQRGLVEIDGISGKIVSTYFDEEGSEPNA